MNGWGLKCASFLQLMPKSIRIVCWPLFNEEILQEVWLFKYCNFHVQDDFWWLLNYEKCTVQEIMSRNLIGLDIKAWKEMNRKIRLSQHCLVYVNLIRSWFVIANLLTCLLQTSFSNCKWYAEKDHWRLVSFDKGLTDAWRF